MMSKFIGMSIAVVLLAVFAIGFGGAVMSQNAGGDIACDSDLVLMWYVADRFFNFNAIQRAAAQTADPATVLDLNRFNQGEFSGLFASLRSVQDPNTGALLNTTLDPTFMSIAVATMQMDDAAFGDMVASMQPADAAALLDLVPVSVGNQAPECAQLRSQLHRFFAAVVFQDVQTGAGAALGLNLNANINANANINNNTNVNGNDNVDDNSNANVNANNNDNDDDDNSNVNNNSNDNDDDDNRDDNGGNSGPGGGGDDHGGDDNGGNSGPGGGRDD